MEKKRKIFTINLYGYLNEEKAKVCKEYQDHNREVIESDEFVSKKYEYTQVNENNEVNEFVNSSECILSSLPKKYYYQLISDLVRYKYMIDNPDSIYLDTDFCMFGKLAVKHLIKINTDCIVNNRDALVGEINKNRIFPCNWLMIGGGKREGSTTIFEDMYNLLKERLTVNSYENYVFSPSTSKWTSKVEDYIWTELWGYAIPMKLDSRKFSFINYENYQANEWNKDWRDANVMKPNELYGCHFFGFGEGGRPDWKEFVRYHNLNIK